MEGSQTVTEVVRDGDILVHRGREYIARQGGRMFEDRVTGLVFAADDEECQHPLGSWQEAQADRSIHGAAGR
jgi:hypothetical protein